MRSANRRASRRLPLTLESLEGRLVLSAAATPLTQPVAGLPTAEHGPSSEAGGGALATLTVTVDGLDASVKISQNQADWGTTHSDDNGGDKTYGESYYSVSYSIDWGDGTAPTSSTELFPQADQGDHTYAASGQYTITISVSYDITSPTGTGTVGTAEMAGETVVAVGDGDSSTWTNVPPAWSSELPTTQLLPAGRLVPSVLVSSWVTPVSGILMPVRTSPLGLPPDSVGVSGG